MREATETRAGCTDNGSTTYHRKIHSESRIAMDVRTRPHGSGPHRSHGRPRKTPALHICNLTVTESLKLKHARTETDCCSIRMHTFLPGQTWCTLVGGGGPDVGLPRKQDGIRDPSLPQASLGPAGPVMYSAARLIGLHDVAEEEEPFERWAWAWRS